MPTHTGPWLQPPDQTLTQLVINSLGAGAAEAYTSTAATDAAMWAGASVTEGILLSFGVTVEPADSGVSQNAFAALEVIWVEPDEFPLLDYTPTLPPHAVSYEYDSGDTSTLRYPFTALAQSDGQFLQNGSAGAAPDPGDGSVVYKRLLPADYTVTHPLPTTSVVNLAAWMTPAMISPRATVFDLPIHPSVTSTGSTTYAAADLDPAGGVALWVGGSYFASAVAPVCRMEANGSIQVTYTYRPRRYRFIFSELPPLRQFPRDDGLGGSPRQGKANGPTSVQASTRQGWRGTYR